MTHTLTAKVFATKIHGRTGQQLEEGWIDAGTPYERASRYTDELGAHWDRIVIDGYLYEVEAQAEAGA